MSPIIFSSPDDLKAHVSHEVAVTDWLLIDQHRIHQFAQATDDHQWIHVDPERCARESPFGAPVAHGFLTLSLIGGFLQSGVTCERVRMGPVNYGLNRVRFMSPVRVDSQVRGRITLLAVEDLPEQTVQATWSILVEIDGQTKPACVADLLTRWQF
ncbi:MAG: MaoC family dehydratase [Burkholderiales bacterium]|nr:MaoC family dehydratase [Burkholderiales bacterium]